MPSGPEPIIIRRELGESIFNRFKKAFDCLKDKNKPVAVFITFTALMPTPDEVLDAKKRPFSQKMPHCPDLFETAEGQFLLVVMAALQDCKRPSNPIRWFTKESLSSTKKEVKKWITQNMNKKKNSKYIGRDLITHWVCAPGFEVDVGIGVGHYANYTAIMSRCKGQHIHLE